MPFPTYTISTDTADGKLHESKLAKEIVAAGYGKPDNVGRLTGNFTVSKNPDYTAAEKTAIDSLVAAHAGTRIKETYVQSWPIIEEEKRIVNPSTWQRMGGSTITPDVWVRDVAEARFHVTFGFKSIGGGATLQLHKMASPTMTPLISVDYAIPDTSDAWQDIELETDIAIPSGRGTFCICAQLDGATEAWVRYGSITLARVKTI